MRTHVEIAMRLAHAKAQHDERIVRSLLGQWVSEFEPSIAYHNGEVIGLCVAGDPSGSIPVRVFDTRPTLKALMRSMGMADDLPTITFGADLGFD